jgi:hypothetical protein
MSRKTKQQKIIADLRRQIRERPTPPPTPAPVKAPTLELKEVSLPSLPASPAPPKTVSNVNNSYLKRDLLKVGGLVGAAVLLEILTTYAISSGMLASWGIF